MKGRKPMKTSILIVFVLSLSGGCRTEETITATYDTGLDPADFTVQALRKTGR